MLDQYENCLFSESCLCGVNLRVDFRNPMMFLQWDTLTSLLNRFLFLSYTTSRDQLAFWNLEIIDEINDREGYTVNDSILYYCYKNSSKVSQWDYKLIINNMFCFSRTLFALKSKKEKMQFLSMSWYWIRLLWALSAGPVFHLPPWEILKENEEMQRPSRPERKAPIL